MIDRSKVKRQPAEKSGLPDDMVFSDDLDNMTEDERRAYKQKLAQSESDMKAYDNGDEDTYDTPIKVKHLPPVISNEVHEEESDEGKRKKPDEDSVDPTTLKFGADDEDKNKGWINVTRLPSNFLGYPNEIRILYRPYTYRELDDFNEMREKRDTIEQYRLMSQGIKCYGMKVEDLYLIDILYILLLRKLTSLGSNKFVGHVYTQDGFRYTQLYTLEDLSFTPVKVPDLPIIANIFGKENVEFFPIRLIQFLQLMQAYLGNNERAITAIQMGSSIPYKEAKDLVDGATGRDMVILKTIDDYLDMGVEPLPITFTHKGEIRHEFIDVNNIDALVAPFCEFAESEGDSIRFGV